MKKILLIGCLLCANLQAQFYNFESAATGSSGISTATARQNTGWTSNGTTAQDTLAIYYLINGKYHRLIIVDTDTDSLIFAPHAQYPIWLKDGTTNLFIVDSTGSVGIRTVPSATWEVDISGELRATEVWASNNVRIANGVALSGTAPLVVGQESSSMQITPAATGFIGIGTTTAAQRQAFVTIRTKTPTADTLFMVRNDKNSTLDSTMMVFANGDGYFGGNNLYQGGHRWRSNAAGDSLILYDGNTMIMAFLSDGTIADLVAGTPPTLWRNGPPQEYIWLLRLGVLLLLLLVAFKVYDYAKPRIRKHKTLPGEM